MGNAALPNPYEPPIDAVEHDAPAGAPTELDGAGEATDHTTTLVLICAAMMAFLFVVTFQWIFAVIAMIGFAAVAATVASRT